MGEVVFDISMSLDGFITGPNEGIEHPLGEDDGRLHDWMFDRKTAADAEVLDEVYAPTGAIIMASGSSTWGWGPGVIRRRSTCRYLW
jgi:hypothetical protein